ncbi:MAG TPA: TrkA C-terminal domain-containing protein [Chondromyces sp.]|nr:TrkA C-terminal domain-containing protein [Chondromyces sp.]
MADYLFILLYTIIIALVIEISAVLFIITGLDKTIARYQVISMLTGTGFTTDESKLIIDHPVRRRISAFLILFGAFSLAVIISSITNILSKDLRLAELTWITVVLFVLLLFGKTPAIRKWLKSLLNREMKQNLSLSDLPINEALYLEEDDWVTSIPIREDSNFIGQTIEEAIKDREDISLLFIKRGEIFLRKELSGEKIKAGDDLFIYGNRTEIEKKFEKELEEEKEKRENGEIH